MQNHDTGGTRGKQQVLLLFSLVTVGHHAVSQERQPDLDGSEDTPEVMRADSRLGLTLVPWEPDATDALQKVLTSFS